jgi:hypothetical protein
MLLCPLWIKMVLFHIYIWIYNVIYWIYVLLFHIYIIIASNWQSWVGILRKDTLAFLQILGESFQSLTLSLMLVVGFLNILLSQGTSFPFLAFWEYLLQLGYEFCQMFFLHLLIWCHVPLLVLSVNIIMFMDLQIWISSSFLKWTPLINNELTALFVAWWDLLIFEWNFNMFIRDIGQ